MKRRLFFALLVTALVAVTVFALGGVVLWADLAAEERELLRSVVEPRAPLLVILAAFAAFFCSLPVRALFKRYVEHAHRLVEDIGLLLLQPERRLVLEGSTDLQAIARAINELADRRQALETEVEARIDEAMRAVADERNRLAALMSELTQSVVVCNLDGRILLYNNRARLQFQTLAAAPGGGEILGLGRSIYAVFERQLIAYALESIRQRLAREQGQAVAQFVTTTRSGQLLRVQMAPVLAEPAADDADATGVAQPGVSGYVMMLDNITVMFETESKRDALLQALTEGTRAGVASIRAAAEMMVDVPDMDAEQRNRFLSVIRDESQRLSGRLSEVSNSFADALKARWPLEEMRGADLIAACARRIESAMEVRVRRDPESIDEAVWLKVDSFSLMQAFAYLSSRLVDEYRVREVRFRLAQEGRLAHLDLCWVGAAVSTETVMNWELEAMSFAGETSPLTVREVIDRCDAEMWFQRERVSHLSFFRFALPLAQGRPDAAERAGTFRHAESRPDYYDFDLFQSTERSHALDDRKLSELSYTVFDTETTGLNPRGGDEIIQIGASRIVNNKLLRGEYFDQLIDPQRELPAASTAIHGITPEMLKGQPTIGQVLPAFHSFAAETVLVAHNAAFDMRFLQLKEEATGCRFDHPVLDTLLLSAIIHPNQESHRLEAIAERFGIPIIGRHTALGDAIVTGEVFLRMIPLLADLGIVTLRQAIEASQKTYYARVDY